MSHAPSPVGVSYELVALQRAVAGRYSIVRELGRGGMGIVFLARDVALERPVAIKLLPPLLALDDAHRARFVREARMAAALSHPNIVPIHSVEEHADLAFFVMGFIDGETLASRVARTGPLRTSEAIRVTQEVAWALAHAHGHGVIHRDVKPDNILLERDSGRAIVTDFGIARTESSATSSSPGAIVGTPRYMSPEQSRGDAVDGRSDLYSLGAVAYFATTGQAPIDGDSAVAILARKSIVTPAPLGTMRSDVPPKFAAAIDRCLAKDATARWDSAEVLAAALQSSIAVRAVPAPVRAFLRESDRSGSEVATALSAAAAALVMIATINITANAHGDFFAGLGIAIEAAIYMGIAAAMTGLTAVQLARLGSRTRGLLTTGYDHSAARRALAAAEQQHDDVSETSVSFERRVAWVTLGTGATVGSFFLASMSGTVLPLLGIASSVAIPAMMVRRLFESRWTRGGLWSRMMRGWLGKAMFRVAGIGLDRSALRLPAAGEPTSLALRTELTELFAALPGDQRGAFADLPDLALRLERQAELLRERTPNPETDRRLQSVVAALEMLRLDLLRLTAAGVDTADLTRDLDAARRISDEIDARLQANNEVGRLLQSDP